MATRIPGDSFTEPAADTVQLDRLRRRSARQHGLGLLLACGFAVLAAGIGFAIWQAQRRGPESLDWGAVGSGVEARMSKHDRLVRIEAATFVTQMLPVLGKGLAERWTRDGKSFVDGVEREGRDFCAHMDYELPPLLAANQTAALKTALAELAAETSSPWPAGADKTLFARLLPGAESQAKQIASARLKTAYAAVAAEWSRAVPVGPPQGEQLATGWRFAGIALEMLLQANAQTDAAMQPVRVGQPAVMRPTRPPKPITPPIAGIAPSGAPKGAGKGKGR
jgi:hypothetical protein